MKKKLILSSLCLILLLIMMLSTTLAWFTDSKANINTMVAGKIGIEQTETDKDGNPFVGSNFTMLPNVEIVKKVTVENIGNQPCYVRTLFAFEDATYTDENGVERSVAEMLTTKTPDGVDIDIPTGANKVQFTVNKDGKTTTYTVGYYVHQSQLPNEENNSIPILESITLKGEADNNWQKAVGDDYELIVLSQASQVSGLDNLGNDGNESPEAALNTAFNTITGEWCATWFAKVLGGTATGNVITVNP